MKSIHTVRCHGRRYDLMVQTPGGRIADLLMTIYYHEQFNETVNDQGRNE